MRCPPPVGRATSLVVIEGWERKSRLYGGFFTQASREPNHADEGVVVQPIRRPAVAKSKAFISLVHPGSRRPEPSQIPCGVSDLSSHLKLDRFPHSMGECSRPLQGR